MREKMAKEQALGIYTQGHDGSSVALSFEMAKGCSDRSSITRRRKFHRFLFRFPKLELEYEQAPKYLYMCVSTCE